MLNSFIRRGFSAPPMEQFLCQIVSLSQSPRKFDRPVDLTGANNCLGWQDLSCQAGDEGLQGQVERHLAGLGSLVNNQQAAVDKIRGPPG